MGYWEIAQMSGDADLGARVAACAAQELPTADSADTPQIWVQRNMLRVASSPGWDEAWSSAAAAGNESPGRDPAVITDEQVLAAVQPLIAQ